MGLREDRKRTDYHVPGGATLNIPPPLKKYLKVMAAHYETTITDIVIRALEAYLDALNLLEDKKPL